MKDVVAHLWLPYPRGGPGFRPVNKNHYVLTSPERYPAVSEASWLGAEIEAEIVWEMESFGTIGTRPCPCDECWGTAMEHMRCD